PGDAVILPRRAAGVVPRSVPPAPDQPGLLLRRRTGVRGDVPLPALPRALEPAHRHREAAPAPARAGSPRGVEPRLPLRLRPLRREIEDVERDEPVRRAELGRPRRPGRRLAAPEYRPAAHQPGRPALSAGLRPGAFRVAA